MRRSYADTPADATPRLTLSRRWLVCFSTLVFLVVGTGQASAHDPQPGSSNTVRTFEHSDEPLFNSSFRTIVGRFVGPRECVFDPPVLNLSANETAVSMRQTEIDYSNCTSVVEIGTPIGLPKADDAAGSSDEETAGPAPRKMTKARTLARIAATSSGYYEVRWEDAVHADVNKTRAQLTWSWNGTCATSASASGYWWWYSPSGWGFDDPSSFAWLTGGCDSYYGHANGHFANAIFCFDVVHTWVNDARFRGGYAGGYGGQVTSTYTTGDCFPLHWHADLVKTS